MAKINRIKNYHITELEKESEAGDAGVKGPTENICKIWFYKRLLARIAIISFGW